MDEKLVHKCKVYKVYGCWHSSCGYCGYDRFLVHKNWNEAIGSAIRHYVLER